MLLCQRGCCWCSAAILEQSDKSLQECLALTDGFNSALLSMGCAVFISLAHSLTIPPFLSPYFFYRSLRLPLVHLLYPKLGKKV